MILWLFTIFSLCAEEHFEVGEVFFEGNKMVLNHVLWEHPIGGLQAKSAEATFDAGGKVPQELTMQEGVTLTLNDGGRLEAPYAWIGCRQCLGVFHGYEGKKVVYEKEKYLLRSLKAEMHFIPPKMLLAKIIAEEAVEMTLEPDLYLTGHQAVFDQFSPNGVFERGVLLSEERGLCCTLKQGNNWINADRADLDLHKQTVKLYDPKGILYRDKTPIHFQASRLLLEKNEERLTLEPPLHIEWLGILDSLGKMSLVQKEKELHSVFVQGVANLDWEGHRLTVYDTLSIDPVLKTVLMTSQGTPVYFRDQYGEIYADVMLLSYNDQLKPLKLTLEGNVRLQNETAGALQYALADEATFEFEKNTLTLKARERPRVLFYDEWNKVQASAPGLTINRDPKSGQNILRGQGNVRFIFAEEELNELKKRFSFEQ